MNRLAKVLHEAAAQQKLIERKVLVLTNEVDKRACIATTSHLRTCTPEQIANDIKESIVREIEVLETYTTNLKALVNSQHLNFSTLNVQRGPIQSELMAEVLACTEKENELKEHEYSVMYFDTHDRQ